MTITPLTTSSTRKIWNCPFVRELCREGIFPGGNYAGQIVQVGIVQEWEGVLRNYHTVPTQYNEI